MKCEGTVGPTFQGSGVRDVGVYEHLSFKQDDTQNAKLLNVNGLWALHFGCHILGFSKRKELCDSVTVSPECRNAHFVFNPFF